MCTAPMFVIVSLSGSRMSRCHSERDSFLSFDLLSLLLARPGASCRCFVERLSLVQVECHFSSHFGQWFVFHDCHYKNGFHQWGCGSAGKNAISLHWKSYGSRSNCVIGPKLFRIILLHRLTDSLVYYPLWQVISTATDRVGSHTRTGGLSRARTFIIRRG